MCSRDVCCACYRKCILCTPPVAFSELRLTGRENATKKKSGWRSDFVVRVENNFLKANCQQFPGKDFEFVSQFIDHLWSDHLSSCQLCCCHPFQFEDHECVLHQDVEDH